MTGGATAAGFCTEAVDCAADDEVALAFELEVWEVVEGEAEEWEVEEDTAKRPSSAHFSVPFAMPRLQSSSEMARLPSQHSTTVTETSSCVTSLFATRPFFSCTRMWPWEWAWASASTWAERAKAESSSDFISSEQRCANVVYYVSQRRVRGRKEAGVTATGVSSGVPAQEGETGGGRQWATEG